MDVELVGVLPEFIVDSVFVADRVLVDDCEGVAGYSVVLTEDCPALKVPSAPTVD